MLERIVGRRILALLYKDQDHRELISLTTSIRLARSEYSSAMAKQRIDDQERRRNMKQASSFPTSSPVVDQVINLAP